MEKISARRLGKNGPLVSDEERFKVYDGAIELGSTYFDSVDIYGDSEELLGKYPHQREKVGKRNSTSVKRSGMHFTFYF